MNVRPGLKKYIALSLLSLLLAIPFVYNFVSRCMSFLLYPVIVSTNALAYTYVDWRDKRKSYQALLTYVQALKCERDELLHENTMLKSRIHDFGLTRDLHIFAERYNIDEALSAHIIAKTLTNNEQTLLVNRGSNHGVERDMIALYGGHLMGKVVQVYPWYSKIQLITDAHSCVAGYTFTSQNHGIVEGANEKHGLCLSFVSRVASLNKGEHVLSSGEGLVFPSGFLLGKITSHHQEPLYHHIELEPLIDFERLRSCLLVAREDIESAIRTK